jgi:hypothetical protein
MDLLDTLLQSIGNLHYAASIGSWLSELLMAYFACWIKVISYLMGRPVGHQAEALIQRIVLVIHIGLIVGGGYLLSGLRLEKHDAYEDKGALSHFVGKEAEERYRKEKEAERIRKQQAKEGGKPTPKEPEI